MEAVASGFAARRPPTMSLGPFQLPPPEIPSTQKLSSVPATSSSQARPSSKVFSVSSVLTPTAGTTGEGLSPLSAGVPSSQDSQSGHSYYGHVTGQWQMPGNPGNYTSYSPGHQHPQLSYPRQVVPPQLSYPPARHPHSPVHYQHDHSGYPTALPSSAPPSQPATPMLASHAPMTQPPATGGSLGRPSTTGPPATSLYAPSTTIFPPSPPIVSPTTMAGAPKPTTTTAPGAGIGGIQAPRSFGSGFPPFGRSGSGVLENLGHPGGPLLINPMGRPGLPRPMPTPMVQRYRTTPPPPLPDRPFRCDQCPQSFNRNHDLKRHKRIHLAIKPFPCGFCDKSFSRRDALKVSLHQLSSSHRVA